MPETLSGKVQTSVRQEQWKLLKLRWRAKEMSGEGEVHNTVHKNPSKTPNLSIPAGIWLQQNKVGWGKSFLLSKLSIFKTIFCKKTIRLLDKVWIFLIVVIRSVIFLMIFLYLTAIEINHFYIMSMHILPGFIASV